MSKASNDLPEFHLVVRRPSRRGPLAPYRFALTVAFALAVSGGDLWDAARGDSGASTDAVLLRAGVASLFIWVLSGIVNGILASATRPPAQPDDQS